METEAKRIVHVDLTDVRGGAPYGWVEMPADYDPREVTEEDVLHDYALRGVRDRDLDPDTLFTVVVYPSWGGGREVLTVGGCARDAARLAVAVAAANGADVECLTVYRGYGGGTVVGLDRVAQYSRDDLDAL